MKLSYGEEIIGIPTEVRHENDVLQISFLITKKVEITYTKSIMKKLTSLIGRKTGLLNIDDRFVIREIVEG